MEYFGSSTTSPFSFDKPQYPFVSLKAARTDLEAAALAAVALFKEEELGWAFNLLNLVNDNPIIITNNRAKREYRNCIVNDFGW